MTDQYFQIDRLIEIGRLHDAERLLGDALAKQPADPELRVLCACLASARGDAAEARTQVHHALANAPTHVRARCVLYDLEIEAERFAEAESLITGLIREDPENAALLALYAKLMLRTFHLEKARALANEALRVEPDNQTARFVDRLLSTVEGDVARADERLSEMLHDEPDGHAAAWSLYMSLIERKRYREALAVGRELLTDDPTNQALVDSLVELRASTHWLAWPLWPMQRFGWGGSAATWVVAVIMLSLLRRTRSPWALALSAAYLGFVIYSWLYPPLMKRWLRWRGI